MRGPYLQQAYKMVSPVFVDRDVSLTFVLSVCVFTTYTQGSSALQLTSSPLTASPGQPYTLMCSSSVSSSSSSSSSRSRTWYWGNDVILRTRYVSETQCTLDIANNDRYREYLSGRVNVSCSYNLYNVTLRVNTSIDNGSVWWCVDTKNSQQSNNWTIHISNLMPSTTTTAATTTTTADTTTTTATATSPMSDVPSSTVLQGGASSDVVSIAVGAAVGGVVVGCVLTVVVVLVWMRRRHRNAEANTIPPNIYTSPSHYEDMEHQYSQVERQYINSVEGMKTDSPDAVNADTQPRDATYYNTVGQHQHLNEDANKGDTTYKNTARDADN